jgi:hypothetical protein
VIEYLCAFRGVDEMQSLVADGFFGIYSNIFRPGPGYNAAAAAQLMSMDKFLAKK